MSEGLRWKENPPRGEREKFGVQFRSNDTFNEREPASCPCGLMLVIPQQIPQFINKSWKLTFGDQCNLNIVLCNYFEGNRGGIKHNNKAERQEVASAMYWIERWREREYRWMEQMLVKV